MKKFFLFFLITGFCFAQDTSKVIITTKANAGINISQIAFTNWAQGGENSFTWTLLGNLIVSTKSEKWTTKNTFKFAFGRTKLGTQDFRTNDNEFFIETVISKNIGWAVDPFISNSIRSPITTGYSYKTKTPERIADFFDPGYVTQTLGFTYDKVKGIKTRLGIALQEVFTNRQRKFSDNPATKDKVEAFKLETGIENVTSSEFKLMENINYKGSLRLFSRFENMKYWDIRWDNLIVAKVNDYINVNLNVLVVYERKQTLRTQVKEAIQLGLIYNLL
ncbi:MAG: DUF3078 domain-containing protein [Ignavibacteria bacterium]|jgi:hypothetical protein|nr:DUF3078 domain-containing protein [Ignavibacteria bacterium]MDH7527957.1 DUF3078 domain-containing protein [Ignavibacteria bacterium]